MKVVLPPDPDGSWRATLSEYQRENLARAARGRYADYREHHRLTVIRTDYGLDIVGLRREGCIDSAGAPIPDAWVIQWVDECYPECVHIDTLEGRKKYGLQLRRYKKNYDRPTRRAGARRRRRLRRYNERCAARMAEWIGSPHTYPGPFPKSEELA